MYSRMCVAWRPGKQSTCRVGRLRRSCKPDCVMRMLPHLNSCPSGTRLKRESARNSCLLQTRSLLLVFPGTDTCGTIARRPPHSWFSRRASAMIRNLLVNILTRSAGQHLCHVRFPLRPPLRGIVEVSVGLQPTLTSTIPLNARRRRDERPCKATSKFPCCRGCWPLHLGQAVLSCADYDVNQPAWNINDFLDGIVADK